MGVVIGLIYGIAVGFVLGMVVMSEYVENNPEEFGIHSTP